MNVAIVGAGNFGTAVASLVARNGHAVDLWMRDDQQLAQILEDRENRRYLKGHRLPDNIRPTTRIDVAGKAEVVFVTVPSASFRDVTHELVPVLPAETQVVSATKGIEEDGFRLMSQILEELLPAAKVGAISGPNLAEEMADGRYTGTVVASRHPTLRRSVQDVLTHATFRVYTSEDVYGVELGGALKNIYAIIAGLATALQVGQNTLAMLITRSLAEMSRFAVALGANPYTFLGLAGVGDLFVTCTSPLSRNFRLGTRLATGLTLAQAMDDLGKLAEGVNTVRVVRGKSRELGVYMPLVDALYRLLYEQVELAAVIHELMTSEQRVDVDFAPPVEWTA